MLFEQARAEKSFFAALDNFFIENGA